MSMQYTVIFHGCKNDNFQIKYCNIFHVFAQNIDCGYTLEPPHVGGSNVYPQPMFYSKKKNEYPCKPQFYYIKVGCKGSSLHGHVFMMYSVSCSVRMVNR